MTSSIGSWLRPIACMSFMLYDMTTKPEYEANIVAAEILIDSDELLDYIYTYRYSAEQIARAMDTDINLVALKIAHLTEIGYGCARLSIGAISCVKRDTVPSTCF